MDKSFLERIQDSKTSGLPDGAHLDMAETPQKASGQELRNYETPLVTVDIVVFTINENRLKVLLIQRKNEPFQHMWAIPGGFIFTGETLEDAASRYLREKTNVINIYLEQLAAFGSPIRDPRSRVITVSYYALVSDEKLMLSSIDAVDSIGWFDVENLPPLAFDHLDIVHTAQNRLKDRLENSSIAFQLLPDKFTLTELQRVYELILGKTLDKRNFRKKVISSGILVDIGETKMEGYHRPAQLYIFSGSPNRGLGHEEDPSASEHLPAAHHEEQHSDIA